MNPIGYRPPELWQLESIDKLIGLIPETEVDWLNANGNLEYYTRDYRRASDLIAKLDNAATQYRLIPNPRRIP